MTKKLLTILLIIALVGLGVFGYFWWQMRDAQKCGIENCHELDITFPV